MRHVMDEQDARACLAAVQAAGGDLAAWARAHGVDGRSLNAWRINLARRPAPETTLVELVPAPSMGVGAPYVLEVGGARLEFDDRCSTDTLRRVLEVLRPC